MKTVITEDGFIDVRDNENMIDDGIDKSDFVRCDTWMYFFAEPSEKFGRKNSFELTHKVRLHYCPKKLDEFESLERDYDNLPNISHAAFIKAAIARGYEYKRIDDKSSLCIFKMKIYPNNIYNREKAKAKKLMDQKRANDRIESARREHYLDANAGLYGHRAMLATKGYRDLCNETKQPFIVSHLRQPHICGDLCSIEVDLQHMIGCELATGSINKFESLMKELEPLNMIRYFGGNINNFSCQTYRSVPLKLLPCISQIVWEDSNISAFMKADKEEVIDEISDAAKNGRLTKWQNADNILRFTLCAFHRLEKDIVKANDPKGSAIADMIQVVA